MVLEALPPVAWLGADAPNVSVVLSSRCRFMRNLVGHRFTHIAPTHELLEIQNSILQAARSANLGLDQLRGMSSAERDHLVGCRFVSHDFAWQDMGRALLLDSGRSLAVMINEEDHLRLQALTAGWSPDRARNLARTTLDALETRLEFTQAPPFGYLAASPSNCGAGRRLSAMFHFIGLAHAQRLPAVLRAVAEKGLAARGLFGESSRAIGAFVQVSVVRGTDTEYVGACEYLILEERRAREAVDPATIESKLDQTLSFVRSQRTISLADGLRVLAWLRWGADAGLKAAPAKVREVDTILTRLELRSHDEPQEADRDRAAYLRKALGL
jgi:protein arginine kinase